MKNKTKCGIIDLLPLVFCFLMYIGANIYLILSGIKPAYCIPVSFCGVLVGYVICVFTHELGHIVMAKINGLKTEYVNFGLFSIDFANRKFIPFTFFGKAAGETKFSAKQKVSAERIRKVAAGGLFFSATVSAIFLACSLLFKSVFYYSFFVIGQLPSIYMLIINVFTPDRLYDGKICSNKTSYAEVLAAIMNVQREIKAGLIPVEPEVLMNDNQPIARYFHFLFTAVNRGGVAAVELLNDIDLNDLSDEEYDLIFPEIIFAACIKGDKQKIDGLKVQAENFFSRDVISINALRAHYEWRKVLGDNKWSDLLFKSYQKTLAALPEFMRLAEKNLNGIKF